MTPIISIIVPVYNVELYLDKCVQSIRQQTFKDFELILVDDGSTDQSGKMCDQYKQIDNRVIVLHKENGGLSSARNAGIKVAKGQYVGFIDSDDYIVQDMYEVLYDLLMKYDADISACQVIDCYATKNILPKKSDKQIMCLTTEQAIRAALKGEILFSACNKLYKRQIFDTIFFPEGKTYEDSWVVVDILKQCKKCVVTTEAKYYYVHRENSITTVCVSKKDLNLIEANKHILDIIDESFPDLHQYAYHRYVQAHWVLLDRLLVNEHKKNELYYFLKQRLKDNAKYILTKSLYSQKRKMTFGVLMIPCIGEKIYAFLMKSKQNVIVKGEERNG